MLLLFEEWKWVPTRRRHHCHCRLRLSFLHATGYGLKRVSVVLRIHWRSLMDRQSTHHRRYILGVGINILLLFIIIPNYLQSCLYCEPTYPFHCHCQSLCPSRVLVRNHRLGHQSCHDDLRRTSLGAPEQIVCHRY